ncbi:SRPBCC family protein [Myxosarcina sp. GI1]|uniref:SRPBCC family protein n=1 Tax=Myxosarcina sp. GI1 TaxID=1541065 RepID=UPI0005681241|nr:SRPBCC family protein [Myxosarcina sp. GI1]
MTLFFLPQRRTAFLICLGAIALAVALIFSPGANAKLFDGPVDKLPVLERAALRQGKVTLAGEKGKYTARILVEASRDAAWQVLTDYDRFENFLPDVDSSRLLKAEGDRKVFEQISTVKTFVFSTEARVRMAVTEFYPQQIDFKAIGGDLKTLNGSWQLEPVSPYPSAPPDSVLITHQVSVIPASSPANSFFYGIYEDRLKKSLAAIKSETEKRYAHAQK